MSFEMLAWILAAVLSMAILIVGAKGLDLASALLGVVCIATIRPSILGETHVFLPLAWLLPGIALKLRGRVVLSGRTWLTFFLFAAGILWPVLRASSSSLNSWMLDVVVLFAVTLAASALAESSRALRYFLSFGFFLALWQILAFIPLLGSRQATGVTFNPLAESGSGRGWTYAFSQAGGGVVYGGQIVPELGPRLTAWFGEPGIFAIFVVVVAAIDRCMTGKWRARQLLALPAIVLTQSFAGAVALAAGLLSVFIFDAIHSSGMSRIVNSLAATASVILGVAVLFGGGGFSLQAKQTDTAQSVSDRLAVPGGYELLETWWSAPFGTGPQFDGQLTQINALVSSMTMGPGLLLIWALIYAIIPWRCVSRTPFVSVVVVIFVTILFSQPPFYPLWLFLLVTSSFYAEKHTLPFAIRDRYQSFRKSMASASERVQ